MKYLSFRLFQQIDYRHFLSHAFIRLCHFYVPKRYVRNTYITSGHFNPDFAICGEPTLMTVEVSDVDKKDVFWSYSKSINPVINEYIVPIEIITYNKGDKTTIVLDMTNPDMWIDDQYTNLQLTNKSITIDGKNEKKKIRLD